MDEFIKSLSQDYELVQYRINEYSGVAEPPILLK